MLDRPELYAQTPVNINLLQPNKFSFVIPGMPHLKYFTQKVSMGTVTTNSIQIETPFSATVRHGDKLKFSELSITFLVDEDMKAWREVYDWMVECTFPTQFSEYGRSKDRKANLYKDAFLTINTNANNPNIRIKFRNCTPLSLSEIQFDTTASADTVMTCTAVFDYDGYDFENVV